MKNKEIPFSMPYIDHEETNAVVRVLEGKWITSGPEVTGFENATKEYLGVTTAVAVSSCTAAMEICLAVSGVGINDDVITTAYTFSSTAMSIIHQGAFPVLVDVEPDTFNIDPDKIKAIINQNYRQTEEGLISKKTNRRLKAIIPVHFAGQAAQMDEINEIADTYGLSIIEDAAHALGAVYKGTKVGKTNNLVCFSFYSNKNLTTGEGGMIVTDRGELEKKLRMYSLHGISKNTIERYKTDLPFYDIVYPGFKANLTDIQAALGVVQMRKLPEIDELRNRVANWYDEFLRDVPGISIPVIKKGNHSARHLYPVLISEKSTVSRDEIIIKLREKRIYPSVHFIPVHFHSFFKQYFQETGNGEIHLPVTEMLFSRELSLPMFPQMSREDVERVATTLKEIVTT